MKEEQRIQQSCVKYFRLKYPDKILFAINNNAFGKGISDARMGGILKSMGVMAGVSDLCLIHNGSCIFIEMKTMNGRQSATQIDFENKIINEGLGYIIIRSLDEFIEFCNEHIQK